MSWDLNLSGFSSVLENMTVVLSEWGGAGGPDNTVCTWKLWPPDLRDLGWSLVSAFSWSDFYRL